VVFPGGHVYDHLNGGVEHFSHEDQGYGDAQGDQLNAFELKIDAGQKRGDPAKEDYTHVAVKKEKVAYAFNGDYQAFFEAVEPEDPAKNSESLHGLFKDHYQHKDYQQYRKDVEIIIVKEIKDPILERNPLDGLVV
jgi:hypothetical protein